MSEPTINDTLQRIAVPLRQYGFGYERDVDAALLLLREAATHAEAILTDCAGMPGHTARRSQDHSEAILALLGATSNGDDA